MLDRFLIQLVKLHNICCEMIFVIFDENIILRIIHEFYEEQFM